jgi:hypothetical protein
VRLVRFAQVLEHGAFPLAEILQALLAHCAEAMGGPIEIEFAGNLGSEQDAAQGEPARFAFLQLRPLALAWSGEAVEIEDAPAESLLCRSQRVLGNGRLADIRDIVAVDRERFQRARSPEAALEVARFDALLRGERRPYLLIGVGRWGSSDPALGLPVQWHQIAGARVIVEAGFDDLHVEPSQGTHLFQNLVAGNVGYFTVNPGPEGGWLDWAWLAAQPAAASAGAVRHVRLAQPLLVQMNGRKGEGAIFKPR